MRRGQPWLALALAAGGFTANAADEKSAPPGAPAVSSESAISAAKREFEAVKAARDPALQQKGALPKMTMPDLHSAPSGVGNIAPKQQQIGEKKSANWLVEAMEKQKPRKDGERDNGRGKGERYDARESTALLTGGARDKDRTSVEPETDPRRRARETEPKNPLASFLGEWMTPQDYALLKPGLEESLAGTKNSPGAMPTPGAGLSSILGSDAALNPATAFNQAAIGTAPRENPYLAALNPPPPPMTLPVPPPTAVSPSVAPAAVNPLAVSGPAPIAPPKPKIPEFAKPAQDEKYFKQLKRF